MSYLMSARQDDGVDGVIHADHTPSLSGAAFPGNWLGMDCASLHKHFAHGVGASHFKGNLHVGIKT